MMTWILWLGALLVAAGAGAGALLKGATVPARVLWLLAELSFVAVLIWGGPLTARLPRRGRRRRGDAGPRRCQCPGERPSGPDDGR